jgi:hypothetical protein
MVKSFNDSGPAAGRIRFRAQKNFEGLAFWVTDRIRRNLQLVAKNGTKSPLRWQKRPAISPPSEKPIPRLPKGSKRSHCLLLVLE